MSNALGRVYHIDYLDSFRLDQLMDLAMPMRSSFVMTSGAAITIAFPTNYQPHDHQYRFFDRIA